MLAICVNNEGVIEKDMKIKTKPSLYIMANQKKSLPTFFKVSNYLLEHNKRRIVSTFFSLELDRPTEKALAKRHQIIQ